MGWILSIRGWIIAIRVWVIGIRGGIIAIRGWILAIRGFHPLLVTNPLSLTFNHLFAASIFCLALTNFE